MYMIKIIIKYLRLDLSRIAISIHGLHEFARILYKKRLQSSLFLLIRRLFKQ
jgi:hypothetical protein